MVSELGKILYEGKAKTIFAHRETDYVIQHFKDTATANNSEKLSEEFSSPEDENDDLPF